jgi:hypothetical protein
MSLQENTPPLVAIIVKIACWVISVKIAFGLVTPKSFFSLILFLVAWGVVELAVDFVAVLILTAVFGRR